MKLRSVSAILVLVLAIALPAKNAFAISYTVSKVEEIVPHDTTTSNNFRGLSLNDEGSIAGVYSYTNPSFSLQPFIWSQSLGYVPLNQSPQNSLFAAFVNNNNQAVFNYTGGTNDGPYLWSPSQPTPQFLGNFNGNTMSATGINDSGQVIGRRLGYDDNAAVWDSVNGWAALPGFSSNPFGINNAGTVVGRAVVSDGDPFLGAYWDSSGVNAIPGTHYALGINDPGQIVGNGHGGPLQHAFLLDSGNFIDLGVLGDPSVSSSGAKGINNQKQIIGSGSEDSTPYVFYWDEINGMQNLNDLIANNPGWTFEDVFDINNNSLILAQGKFSGQSYSVLLTPVVTPEPASMALFGLGAGALAFARRRKRSAR